MTNLEKLGKLFAHFAACDYGHNNNRMILNAGNDLLKAYFEQEGHSLKAYDNGIGLVIEFSYYNREFLPHLDSFDIQTDDMNIRYYPQDDILAAVADYTSVEAMLGIIFDQFILADMETLEMDTEKLSAYETL